MQNFQLPPIDNDKQFEHLMADLLNEHYHTLSFKLFGKTGHQQKGIDIYSAQTQMVVQCKHKDLSRNVIIIKKELLESIEQTLQHLKNNPTALPFATLLIATTASEHPDFDEYAAALRDALDLPFDILFWGWETIQQRLSHLSSTLIKYYPQFQLTDLQIEDKLLARLNMKKRIQHDFADWLNYSSENRRRRSRMILHSSTDTDYPEHPNGLDGPWFWFAAEIARLSTKGLGFINDIVLLYVNGQNQWTDKQPTDLSGFIAVKAAKINVVAFEDIVDYDLKGDEHYLCPHFYVRFNDKNSPFSEVYYQRLENEAKGVPLFLDNATRLDEQIST